MKSYRIFVEKYPEFRVEAESLLRDLNANLILSLDGLRHVSYTHLTLPTSALV